MYFTVDSPLLQGDAQSGKYVSDLNPLGTSSEASTIEPKAYWAYYVQVVKTRLYYSTFTASMHL